MTESDLRRLLEAVQRGEIDLETAHGQLVESVRERTVGEEVQKSLTPGQQVVKIVHEELTELMGSGSSKLAFAGRPPTVILLAGLQGSGKTTTAAKALPTRC